MTSDNLRAERTRFVGRRAELARLAELYASGARLVTIVGPSGMGKTRLAEHFLHSLKAHPDGRSLWFCDLTEARDEIDVCRALARALDLPLSARERDIPAQLMHSLDGRGACLVMLDNFEQLLPAATATLSTWLDGAGQVSFLVTSRERLRLRGEHCLDLGPLSLPGAGAPCEEIANTESVAFFLDRARAAGANLQLNDEQAVSVGELVRRLDGIPLAIELCAARAAMLSPHQLLELLEQQLDALSDSDPTQGRSTLRDAIDWSWQLLTPWQQSALAQCSVFRGGFELEAFAQVAELAPAEGMPSGPAWAVDVLQTLRDKSLLFVFDTDARERRYGVYESIREFASERLRESGSEPATRRRHAEHFGKLGPVLAQAALERGDVLALDRLAQESDNLIAVLNFQLSVSDAEAAARLLSSLHPLFMMRGPHLRFVELADRVRALPELAPAVRAELLMGCGLARSLAGDFSRAVAEYHAGLTALSGEDEPRLRALLNLKLGLAESWQSHEQEAAQAFQRAAEALERCNDTRVRGCYLNDRAVFMVRRGDANGAARSFEAAVAAFRESGSRRDEAMALTNLGLRCGERGELSRARDHYRSALEILQELRDHRMRAALLAQIGWQELEEGELDAAREHCREAERIAREVGAQQWRAMALGYLGHLELEAKQPEQAREHYVAAVTLLESMDPRAAGLFLAGRGAAEARLDRVEDSAASFSRAGELLERAGRHHDADVLALLRGELLLARLRARPSDGELGAALSSLQELLEASRIAGASDELRFARRVLAQSLEALSSTLTPARLVVGKSAYWFQFGERRVDLGRRKNLRLILADLVTLRLEQPGALRVVDEVFAAGWPGQKVRLDAATHRVHVAIGSLRKLGLEGALITRDGGYLIDPSLSVVFSD